MHLIIISTAATASDPDLILPQKRAPSPYWRSWILQISAAICQSRRTRAAEWDAEWLKTMLWIRLSDALLFSLTWHLNLSWPLLNDWIRYIATFSCYCFLFDSAKPFLTGCVWVLELLLWFIFLLYTSVGNVKKRPRVARGKPTDRCTAPQRR